MKFDLGHTTLRINMSFAAAVTLTLILDESGLCAVALFCCIVHEAGHIICLMILGERPASVELSFYGIKLERQSGARGSSIEEIAVYASGPAANVILSALLFPAGAFGEGIRTAAVISLCIGAFNLIPCSPLDGGNILSFALRRMMSEEKAEKICFWISCAVIVPMSAIGMTVLFRSGNVTLIAVSFYLAAIIILNKKQKDNIKI